MFLLYAYMLLLLLLLLNSILLSLLIYCVDSLASAYCNPKLGLTRGSLNSPALETWKSRIRDLTVVFIHIPILHIYQSQNSEADRLSKLGCCSVSDRIIFQRFCYGSLTRGRFHPIITWVYWGLRLQGYLSGLSV